MSVQALTWEKSSKAKDRVRGDLSFWSKQEWLQEHGYMYDPHLCAWIHRESRGDDPLVWPFAVTDEVLADLPRLVRGAA